MLPLVSDDRIAAMRECFSHGDFAAALTLADLVLATQPNSPVGLEFRAKSRAALEDDYAFRLGSLDRVPVVMALPEPMGHPVTDHRTGVVLGYVDGTATVQAIVNTCLMPRLEALRLLYDLHAHGMIAFE
jgi:hypothetical protein